MTIKSDYYLDFAYPEDVLIKVVHKKTETNGWMITQCKIINDSKFIGAASYENLFSDFLQYALKDTLVKLDEGFHRVVGISAVFGLWKTDLDIQYCYNSIQTLTEEEFNA